jgi:hypothetical protein
MAKLLTKFYKLSESWLKTAEIASRIYAYLTVFLIMAVMVMVMVMVMPVLSDTVLPIIAFISLYLSLEVLKIFAVLNVKKNPSNFVGFTVVSV